MCWQLPVSGSEDNQGLNRQAVGYQIQYTLLGVHWHANPEGKRAGGGEPERFNLHIMDINNLRKIRRK
jgi:hypothetical protein